MASNWWLPTVDGQNPLWVIPKKSHQFSASGNPTSSVSQRAPLRSRRPTRDARTEGPLASSRKSASLSGTATSKLSRYAWTLGSLSSSDLSGLRKKRETKKNGELSGGVLDQTNPNIFRGNTHFSGICPKTSPNLLVLRLAQIFPK